MKNLVTSAVLASLLVGCGGGGDSTSEDQAARTLSNTETPAHSESAPTVVADGADKYVGSWKGECLQYPAGELTLSSQLVLTVEKKSANVVAYNRNSSKVSYFNTADCTGSPASTATAIDEGIGDLTIVGTQLASGKMAERINVIYKGQEIKDLAYTADGKLFFGATEASAPLNTDGYPVNLKLTAALTKQ